MNARSKPSRSPTALCRERNERYKIAPATPPCAVTKITQPRVPGHSIAGNACVNLRLREERRRKPEVASEGHTAEGRMLLKASSLGFERGERRGARCSRHETPYGHRTDAGTHARCHNRSLTRR